jgi:hypothetical protein
MEGTSQIRRIITWRETSEYKSGLDLSHHRARFAMLNPFNSLESAVKTKTRKAFLVTGDKAFLSSGLDSVATLIPAPHVFTPAKLSFAPSLW